MRRHGGHEQFDRAGGVHFLADDPLGLFQRPPSQRQIGIGPGHHLVDQARPEHEDVAGDFRPFGRFLHGGDQRAGPVHGNGSKAWVSSGRVHSVGAIAIKYIKGTISCRRKTIKARRGASCILLASTGQGFDGGAGNG